MNYKCPECGANLDPGEPCDCAKEKGCQRTTDDSPSGGATKNNIMIPQNPTRVKTESQAVDNPDFLQRQFCEEHDVLNFTPLFGVCPRCHQSIYQSGENDEDGYTLREAAEKHITYCRRCHKSFLD